MAMWLYEVTLRHCVSLQSIEPLKDTQFIYFIASRYCWRILSATCLPHLSGPGYLSWTGCEGPSSELLEDGCRVYSQFPITLLSFSLLFSSLISWIYGLWPHHLGQLIPIAAGSIWVKPGFLSLELLTFRIGKFFVVEPVLCSKQPDLQVGLQRKNFARQYESLHVLPKFWFNLETSGSHFGQSPASKQDVSQMGILVTHRLRKGFLTSTPIFPSAP